MRLDPVIFVDAVNCLVELDHITSSPAFSQSGQSLNRKTVIIGLVTETRHEFSGTSLDFLQYVAVLNNIWPPDHCGVFKVGSDVCTVERSECGVGPKPESPSELSDN